MVGQQFVFCGCSFQGVLKGLKGSLGVGKIPMPAGLTSGDSEVGLLGRMRDLCCTCFICMQVEGFMTKAWGEPGGEKGNESLEFWCGKGPA